MLAQEFYEWRTRIQTLEVEITEMKDDRKWNAKIASLEQ